MHNTTRSVFAIKQLKILKNRNYQNLQSKLYEIKLNCFKRTKCIGCKDDINNTYHLYMAERWNPEVCTRVERTDAYGTLKFGVYGKTAQVNLI